MAFFTSKASACTDTYPIFTKDKPFYSLPYLDRSANSFFTGTLSLRQDTSLQELSQIPPQNIKPVTAKIAPSAHHVTSLRKQGTRAEATALSVVVPNNEELVDFEDDDDDLFSVYDPDHDDISFVTANSVTGANQPKDPYVFHKWMKTMRHKSTNIPSALAPASTRRPASALSVDQSTVSSSARFMGAVKSCDTSVASFSMSGNTPCKRNSSNPLDPETIARMLDRKHTLEELITTEEYYIRDLKSLKDEYLPILGDCVWISSDVRQAMARNVTEMLEVHGKLLSDITRALPCTTQAIRHHGFDNPINGDMGRYPILADPAAAAEVAKAFDTTIMAFFVYEEYSAMYQEVVRALAKRSVNSADALYGKGTEALIGASNSWDNRGDYGKRAMELFDLLFKPIQRLCKYPLLFRDIEKNTPAIDCPDTNRLLGKVRHRLDEAVHQVNASNNDAPHIRERMEQAWAMQEKLDSYEKSLPVRLLTHVIDFGENTIRRSSTVFNRSKSLTYKSETRRDSLAMLSKSKSPTYKSAPPSPTKRSSSLNSRFSFGSIGKKEPIPEKLAPPGKRRSIIPMLDSNKWRSNLSESDGAVIEATPDEILEWEKEDGYFSIAKPATPPKSVQEDEISIFSALEFITTKAPERHSALMEMVDTNKSAPAKPDTKTEPKLMRRHTTIISPPPPTRSWLSVKKPKPSGDALKLFR